MPHSDLLAAYLAGIDTLTRAVAGLTPDQFRARPIPGQWSTQEVVCHLCDSESLFAERMKRILAEDQPPMPFFDPNRCVDALAYESRDAETELALITLARRQMAGILRTHPSESWQRTGIHSKEGPKTLEQVVRKAVDHLEHHVGFITEKRRLL